MTPRHRFGVVVKATTALLTFVIALEIGLRIYNPLPFRVRGDRIVLPVHQSYTFTHKGATKLDRVTHVTKNSLGFRGPDPPRDWSQYTTVLAIGGSTTECLFLSDDKAWTDQLARRAAALGSRVWINNAGLDGHSTYGHLVLMREYVAALKPSIALFLIGINDMKLGSATTHDRALNPQDLSLAHRVLTFAADHSEICAVGENLARMARTYRADLGNSEMHFSKESEPRIVDEVTSARLLADQRAKYLPSYTDRVRDLVEMCRRAGVEPVLLTQPALYGDAIDPSTGVDLATTSVANDTNGHVEWQLLELYNEATRQVARQAGALAIDVAKEMPKDSRYFSDWVHFTNDGAVVLGDLVYRGLEPRLKAGH